jgi:hypothetical protein
LIVIKSVESAVSKPIHPTHFIIKLLVSRLNALSDGHFRSERTGGKIDCFLSCVRCGSTGIGRRGDQDRAEEPGDEKKRSVGRAQKVFREMLANPFGIDYYIKWISTQAM